MAERAERAGAAYDNDGPPPRRALESDTPVGDTPVIDTAPAIDTAPIIDNTPISDTPVIELHGVSKNYREKVALRDVSMTVATGDVYGLIGRNGAGKTTIMKLVLGLSELSGGRLSINGATRPAEVNAERATIGYLVGQNFFAGYNARANLQYFRRIKGIAEKRTAENRTANTKSTDNTEVDRVLELVGLAGVNAPFREYSMGMKQRLGIANALLGNPRTVILDEPINGLDPQGIVEIRSLIASLNRDLGITFMVSSHILSELALVANRFGFIDDGRLVAELSAAELARATGEGHLQVGTNDPASALQLLTSQLHLTNASITPNGTTVTIPMGPEVDPAAVARVIVNGGLELHELHEDRMSLEDFYFSLTGAAEQHA